MDENRKICVKKTSSGIGLMLFIASITMYTISLILTFALITRLDTTTLLLMDIFISIISLFLVGVFYCWFSDTDINSIIKIKWVKLSLAVPLVFIALTVSFTADYLTEIVQSSFSLFGVENNINLSTESHSLIENILNITAVSIIPPMVEEFLFRGVVLGKLRFFGDSFALFMSSMVFALMHGNIIQIPFAFIVGLALAFLTVKTNSLLPSMAVHFIVNFRSVLLSIFIENNTISEAALNNIYLISLFVVFVLGIISAAILSKRKDFFKLESNKEYPFRYAVKHSILSVGMILFIVLSFINTLQTVSISWLDFSKYLF